MNNADLFTKSIYQGLFIFSSRYIYIFRVKNYYIHAQIKIIIKKGNLFREQLIRINIMLL